MLWSWDLSKENWLSAIVCFDTDTLYLTELLFSEKLLVGATEFICWMLAETRPLHPRPVLSP